MYKDCRKENGGCFCPAIKTCWSVLLACLGKIASGTVRGDLCSLQRKHNFDAFDTEGSYWILGRQGKIVMPFSSPWMETFCQNNPGKEAAGKGIRKEILGGGNIWQWRAGLLRSSGHYWSLCQACNILPLWHRFNAPNSKDFRNKAMNNRLGQQMSRQTLLVGPMSYGNCDLRRYRLVWTVFESIPPTFITSLEGSFQILSSVVCHFLWET